MTFRQSLSRSATKGGVVFLIAAAIMVPASFAPARSDAPETSDLYFSKACWTDSGNHPTPTKVVLDVKGHMEVHGGAMVDKAVEQAVFGIAHHLKIVEFCR